MKLTNAEIVTHFRNITEIINRKEKYPIKFSFALIKNYQLLEADNQSIEKARNQLLDEYNIKDEHGNPAYLTTGMIEIAPEHEKQWTKSMDELLSVESDIPIHVIPISVLENADIDIEPTILYECSFMLEDDL